MARNDRRGERTIDYLIELGEPFCTRHTVVELATRLGRSIHTIYATLRVLGWRYKREKGAWKQS